MATMGYYHGPFAKAVEQQVIERMDAYVHGNKSSRTKFRGQEVANIIWALATTNSLSHEAVAALDPYITDIVSHGTGGYDTKSISQYLNRQEMANLVWSVAVAGHYPPNLIRLLHTGLLGDGKQNAEEVEAIYEDGGFVDNHIMNLLYLQSAMETDGVDVGVSLPPNFLQKWGMATSSRMLDENGISLQLTVSKIQQSVSDAFTRVGFDHVDEHIVPMQGHDLLSIDIADPEQLIGIEVDGPSHFMYQLDHFSPTEPQRGYHKVTNGLLEYQFQFDDVRHKMNGPTALKDRMLQSMGWRMIHIPYGKWYDLDGDTEAEEKYCRKLLEDAKI